MGSGTMWFLVIVAAIVLTGVLLSWEFWDELAATESGEESLSTTIRNMVLIVGAGLALLLAVWRGWVAEQQVRASQESVDAARNSVDAAQEALATQRFQSAAQMLGHDLSAVRLGAIHTLAQISRENRGRYYVETARLLASFVRQPRTGEQTDTTHVPRGKGRSVREDVSAALDYIGSRSPEDIGFEMEQGFTIDLHGKNFERWDLGGLNLARVSLEGSSFHRANLKSVDLTGADISDCSFCGAFFGGAVMKSAKLSNANFTRWYIERNGGYSEWSDIDRGPGSVVGLVQAQLDEASQDEENPPRLRDVQDAETGKQLTWHGMPAK